MTKANVMPASRSLTTWRDDPGDPVIVPLSDADAKGSPERSGDLLRKEAADRVAIDTTNHLAEEVALSECMVARPRSWLPPGGLVGKQAGHPAPIVEIDLVRVTSHPGRLAVCAKT